VEVLNERLEACPDWVVGELYIGGAGLAEGYWQDAARTAERFVEHPDTGARLYRTGDLGRYLPDGNIEFLGREDFQVKIRGYRIELGEIEAALLQHPAIKQAVVLAIGEARAHRQLVAYVAPDPQAMSDAAAADSVPAGLQQRWEAAVAAGRQQARHTLWDIDVEIFAAAWQDLDILYLKAAAQALIKLGAYDVPGERYAPEEIIARGRIASRYHKWVARALQSLVEVGWLRQHDQVYESTSELFVAAAADLSLALSERAAQLHGFGAEEIGVALKAARLLPDVLTETIHSAEIYTSEETSLAYQKMFPHCNAIAREVVAALAQALAPGETLRILEVGSGFGSTTQHLAPILPPEQTTYVFTDISSFFLQAARKEFAAYPFVEYRLLDLEQDPQLQGFERQAFDVVIASSVLHVPRRVAETLERVHTLLAPGGMLLMIEETIFHPSYDLSMGLQQGFDRFEDRDLRPRHPLLSEPQWQQALAAASFEESVVLDQPGSIPAFIGLDVLLARASSAGARLQPAQLRQYLQQQLPDYMVPSAFVVLDALPLTPNGKVDRQALPKPNKPGVEAEHEHVAPRTPLEAQIAELWASVLGLDRFGIHDNFFELGGDSLLATSLVSRLREALQMELPLRALFDDPTVAGVARLVEAYRVAAASHGATPDDGEREEGRL
jgi:SAM-dependent methyltransferase/acyl carrier protein